MATMDADAGLRDRDYFHIMLNLDSFPDFTPRARTLAEQFLTAARQQQQSPSLEPSLRMFPYSRAAFEARLDEIYAGMADDVERYEANRSWTMRTRDDVVEWIRQMAPFNQTDGAWLRNIAPVGPIDPVRTLLFTIWSEELGGGDPQLNHPNLYTDLMDSVGIHLPDIRSREYSDHPSLLDAAFTLPLFQLVVSQFSQHYLPEILGMTQYLEWGSLELKNMVALNQHFGLDPHFYEMHVAIDNASTGHGAMARQAIELHLEQIRVEVSEQAMQAEWERIWTGYVAFATTGNLADEMRRRRLEPPKPADQVAAIVRSRGPKGRLNHGRKQLAGTLINDLFADPPAMMKGLVDGGMIVPGDPDGSPFFTLTTADGPMYKIFNDGELATWRAWTLSLDGQVAPHSPDNPVVVPPAASSAERMRALIEAMRSRQAGVPAHAATKLSGPNPQTGKSISRPVAWWFEQPAVALMRALADPKNDWIRPGAPDESPFVTDLLRGANAMAAALAAAAPDAGGSTWVDVAVEWIAQGCPIPDDEAVRPLSLLSPPERLAAHPTGNIHGSGSVH